MKQALISFLCGLLVLAPTILTAQDFECGRPHNCDCASRGVGYKIDCPRGQRLEIHDINAIVQPGNTIAFQCNTNESDINFEWLAGIEFGQIKTLTFLDCPLMNTTLPDLMTTLKIRGVVTKLKIQFIRDNTNGNFNVQFLKGLSDMNELELHNLGLTELPDDFFSGMNQLTNLDMRENNIQLTSELFSNVPNLKRLELGMNNLRYIEPRAFQQLTKLQLLNLWGNKLQNITRETFSGLSSLKSLDISGNAITSLQADIFADLRTLTTLSLSGNNFTAYPKGIFSNLTLLKVIKLHNNYNHHHLIIPGALLANLSVLEEVYLNHCNISKLPEDLFWGSPNIISLSLSNNGIINLPQFLFKDTNNMTELDIQYNKLEKLPGKIFASLKKLLILKLGHNKLSVISRTLFEGLSKLEQLYMENNVLHTIHADAFSNTPNLKQLYMKNNRLTFINTNAHFLFPYGSSSPLQYCTALEVLELSNNSISEVFSDWNIVLTRLQKLDLSFNKITYVQTSDLHFFSDNVVVDLRYNLINRIDLQKAESVAIGQEEDFMQQEHDVKVELEGNPIHCDCNIYHFLKYLNKRLNPKVYKLVNLIPGNLTCASPEEMVGAIVTKIDSKALACRWNGGDLCPRLCSCAMRREDRALLVNCSHAGLTQVPATLPVLTSIHSIELDVSNNLIQALPEELPIGYGKISKLIVSYNKITKLSNGSLPPNLTEFYLDNNNLTHLNTSVLEFLANGTNLTLHSNPWDCNCDALDLLNFLQTSFKQVKLLNNVTCKDGRPLTRLTSKDICPIMNGAVVAICATIATLGIVVGVLAALYYRYQSEVKVWLYARNLCLWFVTEEELDKDKLYDAFVSYSHKDEDFIVNKLVPGLENGPTSFKLCLHYRDWIAGEWIPNQIARSVEESRRTLVVLSPSFIESVWGRMEFRAAHSQALSDGRARVIVVLYGDIGRTEDLDPELRAYLTMNTYVKWGDPWFWDKLRYALPHSTKVSKGMLLSQRVGQYSTPLEDKLELISPSVTPPVTTPPAEIVVNPMEVTNGFARNGHAKIMVETNGHTNGVIKSV